MMEKQERFLMSFQRFTLIKLLLSQIIKYEIINVLKFNMLNQKHSLQHNNEYGSKKKTM